MFFHSRLLLRFGWFEFADLIFLFAVVRAVDLFWLKRNPRWSAGACLGFGSYALM